MLRDMLPRTVSSVWRMTIVLIGICDLIIGHVTVIYWVWLHLLGTEVVTDFRRAAWLVRWCCSGGFDVSRCCSMICDRRLHTHGCAMLTNHRHLMRSISRSLAGRQPASVRAGNQPAFVCTTRHSNVPISQNSSLVVCFSVLRITRISCGHLLRKLDTMSMSLYQDSFLIGLTIITVADDVEFAAACRR